MDKESKHGGGSSFSVSPRPWADEVGEISGTPYDEGIYAANRGKPVALLHLNLHFLENRRKLERTINEVN